MKLGSSSRGFLLNEFSASDDDEFLAEIYSPLTAFVLVSMLAGANPEGY